MVINTDEHLDGPAATREGIDIPYCQALTPLKAAWNRMREAVQYALDQRMSTEMSDLAMQIRHFGDPPDTLP